MKVEERKVARTVDKTKPLMVVKQIVDGVALCVWFAKGELRREEFRCEELVTPRTRAA